MLSCGAPGQPDNRSACLRFPVRRAQPDERRHEIHAPGILNRPRHCLGLTGALDESQSITQPLNRSARNEDRTLQGEYRSTAGVAGNRGEQAARRSTRIRTVSHIHQQEGPRTVSAFCLARRPAALPVERSLLISGDAGYRSFETQVRPVYEPHHHARAVNHG